jgi:hypothetical protein
MNSFTAFLAGEEHKGVLNRAEFLLLIVDSGRHEWCRPRSLSTLQATATLELVAIGEAISLVQNFNLLLQLFCQGLPLDLRKLGVDLAFVDFLVLALR